MQCTRTAMAAVAAAGATTVCQFPKKGMMKKRGQGVSTFGVKNWKVQKFSSARRSLTHTLSFSLPLFLSRVWIWVCMGDLLTHQLVLVGRVV